MSANKEALLKLLATADKKFDTVVGPMSQIATESVFVSTGNMAIDYVTGGGIPLGRITELSGFASSGKTTTALQAAAELQKIIKSGGDPEKGITPDDVIMYFDYEQAMDPTYAKALGLDVDDYSFQFSQPSSLENGANLAIAAGKTGAVRMMIFDSVATMIPDSRIEKDVGEYTVGLQAKLLTDFGNNMNIVAADHNIAVVLLNHTKEKLGMGGRPGVTITTTPGGVGLKFLSSVRVEYAQRKQNKSKVFDDVMGEDVERVMSTDVKIKTVKNKLAPPFREAMVRVRFGKGFDNFYTALQILISRKIVKFQGAMYYFHELEEFGGCPDWMPRASTGTHRPYIKGLDNVLAAADADPEWAALMIKEAEEILHNPLPLDSSVDVEFEEEEPEERPSNKVSL